MAALWLALLPSAPAAACAVCFGFSDNPNIGKAIGVGILMLLATTFAILTVLGAAVYRIEKARHD